MADTTALSLFAVPGVQDLATDGSSGRVVTGREKLAERVILEVLTAKRSLRFLPGRGTVFLDLAGNGRAMTELDAFAAFSAAARDAVTNLRAEEQDTDEDESRIAGFRPTGLDLTEDGVIAHITVYSRAGTASRSSVFLEASIPDSRAVFSPD